MTTDKLKRVQSVRKWLEKAEQSFSRHRDILGELNLMMARAEMQRLDETRVVRGKHRILGNRILAMAAAVALIIGVSEWKAVLEQDVGAVVPAAELTEHVTANHSSEPNENEPRLTINNKDPVYAERYATSALEEAREPEKQSPVLTEFEIQRVVGQAGRALRGQS